MYVCMYVFSWNSVNMFQRALPGTVYAVNTQTVCYDSIINGYSSLNLWLKSVVQGDILYC